MERNYSTKNLRNVLILNKGENQQYYPLVLLAALLKCLYYTSFFYQNLEISALFLEKEQKLAVNTVKCGFNLYVK